MRLLQRKSVKQEALVERFPECPVFVGISGGTCSGKTSLALQLHQLLDSEGVNIISHDNYYLGWSHLPPEERERINFDHPEALETDLLVEHLSMLRRGKKVRIPIYDFKHHIRHHETREVVPKPFTIVEGILLFHEPTLRDALDLRVFLEISSDTMFRRRLERDMLERGRTAESVKSQLSSTVYPMYLQFIEPYKKYAHMVIQEETTLTERTSLVMNMIKVARLTQELIRNPEKGVE